MKNKLVKKSRISYNPGSPYVPATPGSPGRPASWELVTTWLSSSIPNDLGSPNVRYVFNVVSGVMNYPVVYEPIDPFPQTIPPHPPTPNILPLPKTSNPFASYSNFSVSPDYSISYVPEPHPDSKLPNGVIRYPYRWEGAK